MKTLLSNLLSFCLAGIILDDEDDDDYGDGDIDDDDDDDDDIHCDNFVPSCSVDDDDDGDGGNDAFFPCDSGGGVHGEDG